MRDAYQVLGLGPRASRDDVRAAYRRLARRWHPDLHATAGPELRLDAERRMKELNAAYDAIRTGRATVSAPIRAQRTAWDDFATAFRDTVRSDERSASWYAVSGPTVLESLRDIRDILFGRQSPPLTIDQVARRLRVSPRTVLRLVERGILQANVIAGAMRITTDALANYLLGREPRPARRA